MAKAPKGKAAKPKPTASKPAKGKATAPKGKAAKPKPSSAPTRRPGIAGTQSELPGTEQKRNTVIEREWNRRVEAAAARKAAAEDFAQAEANIQAEFTKLAEADDPRAHAYRVESGDLLRPQKKPTLKVTRKPSREAKAEAKTKRAAAATQDEPFLPDDTDPASDDDASDGDADDDDAGDAGDDPDLPFDDDEPVESFRRPAADLPDEVA